jgi:DNA-binding transcriptional LysR family regulator
MNLSQLETFLTVARTGSFTRAADLVHLTQSAVSRQVQDLEESLGVQLFERLGRTISLTHHGKILVEEATRLLQNVKNVKDRLRDLDEEMSGDLRVGATVTAANTFLPSVLADFRRKNPRVNLSLQPGQSMGLLTKIRSNELDVAITGPVEEHPDLTSFAAIEDELVLVGAADHFLARKGTLKPNQLQGVGFISRDEGSDTQSLVNTWFRQHEVRVNTVLAIP